MTKALMVGTNTPTFKKIQRATGIWLKEATHFNDVMTDNGIDVDYLSPNGGYIPIDPSVWELMIWTRSIGNFIG